MTLLADVLLLAAGIVLLVAGGESLVRGAAALAHRLRVPSLVVGLTVVAFGTSAPELSVNVTAALRGSGEVAFGNVIGSNLANVGLILALAALVRPLAVQSIVITREIPMMLLASTATLLMGLDALRLEPVSRYDRPEGLLLLLLFAIFLYYTIGETLRMRVADSFVQQIREHEVGAGLRSLAASSALVALGLAGLTVGGRLAVDGAVGLAEALGAPKELIGLSVVAIGTSLPELSASVMAARQGETDLAVGNVVGSNLFNLLFVLGVTATIHPVPVPAGGAWDLAVMVSLAAVLLPLARSESGVTRLEGAMLLAAYAGYLGWRVL